MIEPKTIVLMGVSGSGKTTIGRALSQTLGYSFFDADDFHPQKNIDKMNIKYLTILKFPFELPFYFLLD